MLGWAIAVVSWICAFFCWWKTRKDTRVRPLCTSARWLFGIFIFLSAFDVWSTFFMVLWLGIAIEANPVFGTDLTLPMALVVKTGQIFFCYFSMKFASTGLSEKQFNAFSVAAFIFMCAMMFAVAVSNEGCFYRAVYAAVRGGYLF